MSFTANERLRKTGHRTLFLFLDGSRELIAGWMQQRRDHFMPPGLLDSQFETLEPPEGEPDVMPITLSADWKNTTEQALSESRKFLDK
jgi:gluconokinase